MNGGEMDDSGRVRQQPEGTPTLLIVAALLATACFGTLLVGAAYLVLHEREGRLRASRRFDEKTLHLRDRVSGVLQQPFDIPRARPTEREQQERSLQQFGWVDRPRRVVHIPIEEAMRLMAEGRAPRGAAAGGGGDR